MKENQHSTAPLDSNMSFILKQLNADLSFLFGQVSAKNGLASEIASRGFAFPEIEHKKVLFIGMNPSFIEGSIPESFTYKPSEAVQSYPKYFKKFHDLAIDCGIENDWTCLDLLFLRETDQKKVLELLKNMEGLDFVSKQIQMSIDLIEEISPELIVVCNSAASLFFGIDKQETHIEATDVWMGYNFEFRNNFGVDIITGMHKQSIKKGVKSTNLRGTPVLFTSSLNYMDKSSKKRLALQIKNIMKYHSLFFGKSNFKYHPSNEIPNQLKILSQKIVESYAMKIKALHESNYEKVSNHRKVELIAMNEIVKILVLLDN